MKITDEVREYMKYLNQRSLEVRKAKGLHSSEHYRAMAKKRWANRDLGGGEAQASPSPKFLK